MTWAENVGPNRMGIIREKSEGNRHFLRRGYVGAHWNIILKCMTKLNGRIWAVFKWFRIGFIEGLL
jgi:GT2 family glycosyltransferase